MCTLSFVPTQSGYLLAMNRDERLTRAAALPPSRFHDGTYAALYPYEPSGGTWIAVNEAGTSFALLNLNIAVNKHERRVSRGALIPKVVSSAVYLRDAETIISGWKLEDVLPFRLVGFFPHDREISEWVWDARSLHSKPHRWCSRHWFSSGASDEKAERSRGAVCAAALQEADASTLPWLQRLHRSHAPERGAFSVCAHRDEAGTVSYTEVVVDQIGVELNYRPGPACMESRLHALAMERARRKFP